LLICQINTQVVSTGSRWCLGSSLTVPSSTGKMVWLSFLLLDKIALLHMVRMLDSTSITSIYILFC